MAKLPSDLTIKQKKFSKHYIASGNAAQAALAAGYSKNSAKAIGHENLTKPAIKNYIEQSMQETMDKLGITIEWKAQMLRKCAERCMPDDEGARIRPTGMINAISELNKMSGHHSATKLDIV